MAPSARKAASRPRKSAPRAPAAARPRRAAVVRRAAVERSNDVQVQSSHAQGARWARKLEALGQRFLTQLGLEGCELSVSLVGDTAIRRLNRTWRHKDKATDVLSFPAGELPRGTPGPRPLGDVVISLDTARRQAREYRRTLGAEVARYLAHGLLHLLGHDHELPREARRMARLEEELLGERGMVGDATEEE